MKPTRISASYYPFIVLFCALGTVLTVTAAWGSILDEEFSVPDFSTPAGITTHVFNFFHHSCGANLLSNGLRSGLTGLGYTIHSCIDYTYWNENNYTDYRHWYKRFQRELGVRKGGQYYRYEGPGPLGSPLYSTVIPQDEFMLTWYEAHAEVMDIIMFKPCYPGSHISNYDTQFDTGTGNNGYGNVVSGTPYSDDGNNNFEYLNSSASVTAAYDATYWSQGAWSSASASLAQIKCAYRGMLNIFAIHPDRLFIAMQAPPMVALTDDEARNNRELARWFREDWLHQYDPTGTDRYQDYPLENVVPADFFNSVAWTGNDASFDAEYFWFIQGGFPDNTLDNTNPAEIGRNAGSADHPESWLNQRTAVTLCGGTDTFSEAHNPGYPQRTYDCWINAVVNRWEKSIIPVPATSRGTHLFLGLALLLTATLIITRSRI